MRQVADRLHLAAAAFVGDDRRMGREDEVAVRVVAVAVRVDQRVDGLVGDGPQRPVEGQRPCLGARRIDHRGVPFADDHAGVVQEPAAVHLDVGEDPLAHFLDDRRRDFGVDRDRLAAHCWTILMTKFAPL